MVLPHRRAVGRLTACTGFWLFQGIETALFVALAVVLVLVAVQLIRRRTARLVGLRPAYSEEVRPTGQLTPVPWSGQ
jgi:hypothetical protein